MYPFLSLVKVVNACYTDTFVALHSSTAMPYSTNNRLVLIGRGRGGDSNNNNNNSNNSNSDIVITLSSRTEKWKTNSAKKKETKYRNIAFIVASVHRCRCHPNKWQQE